MSSLLPEITKKSKKQIVYERIKEEIINNKLKPGTLLIERQLCDSLEISRTPVREALHQLTNEGLVDIIEGKGAFVSEVTYEDIVEIYTVREALEGIACKLCTLLISNEDIDSLENIFKILEKAVAEKDYDIFVKQDIKFHDFIIDSTKNSRLKNIISNMIDQIKRITQNISGDEKRINITLKHHAQILQAIKNRDGNKAEKVMREHINNSKEYHIKKLIGGI